QWSWSAASDARTEARLKARDDAQQTNAAALAKEAPREYVLEVIGLGVSLDKHRQGKLWDALQKSHPFGTIREQDPEKYAWTGSDKLGEEGGASASALTNGIGGLPMYWPAPSFYASNPIDDPNDPSSETDPIIGIVGATDSNGLDLTLFIPAGYMLADHPDRLLEKAFAFFDAHPDVPYLVVAASDGLYFRHLNRPPGSPPLLYDGYYVPSMPASSALFVLARRERVEVLRPFAFEDTDQDKRGPIQNRYGLARRLFLSYADLAEANGQAMGNGRLIRVPTVPEWLAETARFAKRPDVLGPESVSLLHPSDDVVHVPKGYKPTPWFPIPWNKYQLEVFDRLPTLGYLHRPTYIQLTDADGKPLTRQSDRTAALIKGWQDALLTLPEAQRKGALKRLISSTGDNPDKLVELTALINAQAEAGGPELRLDKPSEWINLDPRLGNTGSASWFMGMAIGVMGSYIDGGVSAAINLRNDREASLIFISPPPPEKVKAQGSAIFKNNVTPAIDPANYAEQ
uniref:type VI lipase adapter Tla3 domain-containing protein n=1 Tax=Zoogloea ramigera TaxID=350 RepID=UPI003FA1FE7C